MNPKSSRLADPFFHINKKAYEIPFVCGATELGEAVRRIHEGAAMIRTKGEAGTGNLVAAVTHSTYHTRNQASPVHGRQPPR